MRKIIALLVLVLAGLLIAGQRPAASQPSQFPSGHVPVTGNVPRAAGWKTETVLSGLEHPWAMAWLPDGDMLITERPGRLRRVSGGKLLPEPIAGVPEVMARGQGGLLDIALHPQFAANGLLYLSYAAGSAEENRTTVARARLAGNRLEDLKVIFQNPDAKPGTQHFGSRLVWLKDGTLLISVGDGGNPPVEVGGGLSRRYAQDITKAFGKVHRIKDDGGIPSDNPFVNKPDAFKSVYSYGHRNIQGMVFDPASGRVYANEHGSRGGDELNIIISGANYGWPLVSYSNEYSGGKVAEKTSAPGVTDPIVVWSPSPAPSGLAVYTGSRFPKWKGDLFSGCLAGQELRHIDLDDKGAVIGQDALHFDKRIRDVRQGPDAELYVLTDEDNGELLRIVPQ